MRRALAALVVSLTLLGSAATVPASASSSPIFPKVIGGYGVKPTLKFPSVKAPTVLESKVLTQGKGPTIEKKDLVVVNYLGQIWRGKVFDASFNRDQLLSFVLGANPAQVIKGWETSLVGMRVGSRVLLVIPPADGYGKGGDSAAGITGTDTLVFIVDLVAEYGPHATGSIHATGLRSTVNGITIHGALGTAPVIQILESAPLPASLSASVVARGSGPKVKAGLVVMQYVAAQWTNQVVGSTWASGEPEADQIGDTNAPSFYDALIGFPVGSRMLVEIPKGSQGGPYALVIDIVGQPVDPQHK